MARPSSHLILLLFIAAVFSPHSPSSTAQPPYRNISLGSTLSTDDLRTPWLSPSGDFAFGFYLLPSASTSTSQQQPRNFSLAIWYANAPGNPLVWYATQSRPAPFPVPAPAGSRVELANDGFLRLLDPQGRSLWSADSFPSNTVTHAAMLDTGDFVLVRGHSDVRWWSFDTPTDTLLPTQVFGLGSTLSSRLSETDFSAGRFQLRLLDDGNLVLNTVEPTSRLSYAAYYVSNTFGSGMRLIYNESGYITFQQRNGSALNFTQGNGMLSTRDFYQRATLDVDGVFRQYVYPKSPSLRNTTWANSNSWSVVWSFPGDICGVDAISVGSGTCGFNSYCRLDDDRKPICECPPGFSFIDPGNRYKGCKLDPFVDACNLEESSSRGALGVSLVEVLNLDWPSLDSTGLSPINEEDCREACLSDCFCVVAIFWNGGCYKKNLPLSNGRFSTGGGVKALIKVWGNSSTTPSLLLPDTDGGRKRRRTFIVVGSVLLGSSAFINGCFLSLTIAALLLYSRRKKSERDEVQTNMVGMNPVRFSFKDLEHATGGFKEEVGRGAFGTVYKGSLPTDPPIAIAVKKLENVKLEDGEKEFETEVRAVSQTYHRNLVQLLGYCHENSQRLLVYEYMSNGSLASFLFGPSRPSWEERTKIAMGIARGLVYLHEEGETQVIHCDIKPQNILLDDTHTARISDFGLAKLLKADQTRTRTGIRGTKGYVAPEWFKSMAITAKVDVYSFGVMLLEVVCSRKNLEVGNTGDELKEGAILVDWAYDRFVQGRPDLLVSGDEEAMEDLWRLERFIKVGFWCIQEDPSMRPPMKKVLQMLEGAAAVPLPPDPSSFLRSTSFED